MPAPSSRQNRSLAGRGVVEDHLRQPMLDLAARHAAERRVDEVVDRRLRVLHAAFPDEAAGQREEAGLPVASSRSSGRPRRRSCPARDGYDWLMLKCVVVEAEAGLEVLADRVPRDPREVLVGDVAVVDPGQRLRRARPRPRRARSAFPVPGRREDRARRRVSEATGPRRSATRPPETGRAREGSKGPAPPPRTGTSPRPPARRPRGARTSAPLSDAVQAARRDHDDRPQALPPVTGSAPALCASRPSALQPSCPKPAGIAFRRERSDFHGRDGALARPSARSAGRTRSTRSTSGPRSSARSGTRSPRS